MNTKHHLNHLKLALIVGSLALPLITQAGPPPTKEHPRYKLIDLGTLGGPEYYLDFSGLPPTLAQRARNGGRRNGYGRS